MKHAALVLIPTLTLLAGAEAPSAEAKSKAFCREWAQDVADRNANGVDVVAGTMVGALGGALLGGVISGGSAVGKGALIGGATGALVTGVTTGERRNQIYRRAYAECRAS